jgi:Zn-dependent alcohol dehydrogenase
MRRSVARLLAIPVVSAGVLGGIAVAAPAASAQTDTGGTVAITVPFSYIKHLAKAGVVEFPRPLSELSVNTTDQTATVTFTVTGGDGNVNVFLGSLDLSGSLVIIDVHHAKGHHARVRKVAFDNLELNLQEGEIVGTPKGSTTVVPLLDVAGTITSVPGNTTQSYNASELNVDPAGVSYLNSTLRTSVFNDTADVGSMAATWSFSF